MSHGKFRKRICTLSIAAAFVASLANGSSTYGFDIPNVPERLAKAPYAALLYADAAGEAPGAEKFCDVPKDEWYYSYVDRLVADGIIKGMTSTEFVPDGNLKVSESAALVVRALGLDGLCEEYEKEWEYEGELGSLWFRPYVGILLDTGVVEDGEYGLSKGLDGIFRMESRDVLESPITRSQFAKMLARMTVLDDNYSCIEAGCDYPERSIYGHEFIRGGMYDDEAIEKYAGGIADYSEIAEEYVPYVLMGYYNGLFNGDDKGNFNPSDNLRRSEMAKLMAVVTYPELRHGEDFRSAASVIPEGALYEDYYGKTALYKNAGEEILRNIARNTAVTEDGKVEVSLSSSAPLGYAVEVFGYIWNGTGYEEKAFLGLGSEGTAHGASLNFDTGNKAAKVLYVLRDLSRGGEAVGALDADIVGGEITFASLIAGEEAALAEVPEEPEEPGEAEGTDEPEGTDEQIPAE